jgi:BioD-like phosphotransacetylase family protein
MSTPVHSHQPAACIYVGATAQHVGKTTVTLGLLNACKKAGLDIGFMKPVGQKHIELRGERVDKDVKLAEIALGHTIADPRMLSPVIAPRGFTENYIFNPEPAPLHASILDAYYALSAHHRNLIAEGTGHAGVGACFDLSNAQVASLLGAKVVLVSEGGIGRALDQIALNMALFKHFNVEVLGVVANKVIPEKMDRIQGALSAGLHNLGSRLLGCIPYEPELTYPTMEQIASLFQARVICNGERMEQHVKRYVVAAMEPEHAIDYVFSNALVIMPGDRVDNMLIALGAHLMKEEKDLPVSGILLTGNIAPPESIIRLLDRAGLPVLVVKDDTYEAASKIRDTTFKIQPDDMSKIEAAELLVQQHVDVDYIMSHLAS